MERVAIPFITYRENDIKGVLRYYILQRDFPNNIGVILSQPNHKAICQSVIPGYNLWVVWDGTLRGNFVAAYPDFEKELRYTMDNMAAWFWAERIVMDKKRFKQFKVENNATTTQ